MRARSGLALVLAAALCATGCFTADLSTERRAIERHTGLSLEPDVSLHIGPMLMGIAGSFTEGEDGDDVQAMIRACSSIDVAVYQVSGDRPVPKSGLLPAPDGWSMIARVRQPGESVQVYALEERGKIRRVLLTALDGDELVVMRLRGDVGEILRAALAISARHEGEGEGDAECGRSSPAVPADDGEDTDEQAGAA